MVWWSPATVALYLASGLLFLGILLSLRELLSLLIHSWKQLDSLLHAHQSYKIPMYNDFLQENPLHRRATTYLSSLSSLEDSNNAFLFSSVSSSSRKQPWGGGGSSDLYLKLDAEQTVHDFFLGAGISWKKEYSDEALVLKVRKRDRRRVLRPYLQHIEAVADEIDLRRQEVKLFTNSIVPGCGERRRWRCVPFTHPSTMDNLAMDPDLKNRVKSDLESFLKNKLYYHRLGRVWRRSYLLFGPPGTGKSSFIAAMAKFLFYDVYDLDLSYASDGSFDLKALVVQTSPRSVIVIEDLDRYLERAAETDTTAASDASVAAAAGVPVPAAVVFVVVGFAVGIAGQ